MSTTTQTTGLTLGQRIMADSPPFFNIIKILSFLVIVAAVILSHLAIVPANIILMMQVGAAVAMAIAQTAVKDAESLAGGLTIGNVIGVLSDISNQVSEVKTIAANPPPLPDLTTAITNALTAIKAPAVTAVTVEEPGLTLV